MINTCSPLTYSLIQFQMFYEQKTKPISCWGSIYSSKVKGTSTNFTFSITRVTEKFKSNSTNFNYWPLHSCCIYGHVCPMQFAWLGGHRNCQLNLFPMCWDLILYTALIIQTVSEPKAEKAGSWSPSERSKMKVCWCFHLLASAVKHQLSSDSSK